MLWDAENRLVLCNSNFQNLHSLPDDGDRRRHALRGRGRGRPQARDPHPSSPAKTRPEPGARTFEAQLDDGRWLQISERRTKDGGYVSVGTDITPLKLHEKKLIDSEQRLMATVTDLRQSQQKLELQTQHGELAEKYAEENAPRRPTRPSRNSSPT